MEKLALGLGVLLLLFFTQVTPERIERRMEKALQQSLPAKSVNVELDGAAGFPTLKGKFRKLTVQIDGLAFSGGQLEKMLPVRFTDKPEKEGRVSEVSIQLRDADYDGLSIAELQAQAQTVRFDLKASLREKRLVLVSASTGTLKGFIAADALQSYLAGLAIKEGVEDLQVTLRSGDAEMRGKCKMTAKELTLLRIPFSAVVELFPANTNEVHWRLVKATVAEILPLPASWLQDKFKALNPLLRFDLTPLQINLHTVTVTPKGVGLAADFSLAPK